MTNSEDKQSMPPVPPKETGLGHLLHSARYSLAGLGRLFAEPAFRQELAGFGVLLLWHLGLGSPTALVLAQIVAALVLFALEAVNTALEELIDHVSPGYSRMAKHAKDLGSFAVLCLLLANGLVALAALVV